MKLPLNFWRIAGMIFTMMQATHATDNPFFQPWETPYGTPPFEAIAQDHYLPAILHGIELEKAEVNAIAENPDRATFENTIVALDQTGAFLTRVMRVFNNLSGTDSDEILQRIDLETTPLLSAHYAEIRLRPDLFERVREVYESRHALKLESDQLKLLEDTYDGFVRGGALLEAEAKQRYKEVVKQLSVLTLQFGENVREDTTSCEILVESRSGLEGLPESIIQAAARKAEERGHTGRWLFLPTRSNVEAITTYAHDRDLRRQLYLGYVQCGMRDNAYNNESIIAEILNLRLERAQLLGYANHAAYALDRTMAKTPEAVMELVNKIWEPGLEAAQRDIEEMRTLMSEEGLEGALEPWDYRYFMEKIRAAKYDLSESELMPYFSFDNVLRGIFLLTEKLYGITVVAAPEVQTYREDVQAWKVIETNGDLIGIFYTDYFIRDSKRAGAWMSAFRTQSVDVGGKRVIPHIVNVLNVPPAAGDAPVLLNLDEVNTAFHEFGHALHGLLSDVRYHAQAGTSVTRDFVELPSQVLENWAFEPALLREYALHHKTGEVIPDDLIEKIRTVETFNQGFFTTEYLAATLLDMEYHRMEVPFAGSVKAFEDEVLTGKYGLMPQIAPRYHSSYFQHIFSGGYAAGYYSYLWSELLDADAFEAFREKGLFDQTTAASFREHVLSKGGSGDPMELYKAFRGKEPETEPLLKRRGFL